MSIEKNKRKVAAIRELVIAILSQIPEHADPSSGAGMSREWGSVRVAALTLAGKVESLAKYLDRRAELKRSVDKVKCRIDEVLKDVEETETNEPEGDPTGVGDERPDESAD